MMNDNVKNPKHYHIIEGVESIDLIASGMTLEMWRGFCLGNIIKYRLRAGKKDALDQDIAKSDFYEVLFETKSHLCIDVKPTLENIESMAGALGFKLVNKGL